jgi:hypothetical protein
MLAFLPIVFDVGQEAIWEVKQHSSAHIGYGTPKILRRTQHTILNSLRSILENDATKIYRNWVSVYDFDILCNQPTSYKLCKENN